MYYPSKGRPQFTTCKFCGERISWWHLKKRLHKCVEFYTSRKFLKREDLSEEDIKQYEEAANNKKG